MRKKGTKSYLGDFLARDKNEHAAQDILTAAYAFSESMVECECGARLLLAPDLKAMDRVIDAHVKLHRRMHNNSDGEDRLLQKILVEALLIKASGQKGRMTFQ